MRSNTSRPAPRGAPRTIAGVRLSVIVAAVALLLLVASVVWPQEIENVSGEAVAIGAATHVTSAVELEVTPGQPPAGGPHFAQPLAARIYGEPVEDGRAIHSLEHGMLWITYRADLIAPRDLETLQAAARAYSHDVILSPRPQNSAPASIAAWGRRLTLDIPLRDAQLRGFITAHVNRAPEPGVR